MTLSTLIPAEARMARMFVQTRSSCSSNEAPGAPVGSSPIVPATNSRRSMPWTSPPLRVEPPPYGERMGPAVADQPGQLRPHGGERLGAGGPDAVHLQHAGLPVELGAGAARVRRGVRDDHGPARGR